MKVLFVCTGNICRSPMAERLTRSHGEHLGVLDLVASSAGTRAVIGHPMHAEAAHVLERLGGQPSGFVARQLTHKIAGASDLILTMTKEHRDAVLHIAPRALNRTFTLGEASALVTSHGARAIADLAALRPNLPPGSAAEVRDPIGEDPTVHDAVGHQIAGLLRPVLRLFGQAPP